MTRQRLGALALAAGLLAPAVATAYFPPNIGMPPPTGKAIPPDPFEPPVGAPLGEPEPPDPGPQPSVQTPEPASVVSALTGLALAAGYGLRKRMKRSA
jgi:hypothetical protein